MKCPLGATDSRVLFVGMGGGNDIFSTLLAIASLKEDGWRWQHCGIAGPIGPFFRYYGIEPLGLLGRPDIDVYQATPDMTRFLWRRDMPHDIGLVNAAVARMLQHDNPLGVLEHLALPLNHGSFGTTMAFQALAKTYDYFVLIDVGGDVLYSGPQDKHVISPMYDAIVLQAFLDANVPGKIFLAGPNTDGETDIESLVPSILMCQPEIRPLKKEVIDWWEGAYNKYIALSRRGNTVPRTVEAFRSKKPILTFTHRTEEKLGKNSVFVEFPQKVSAKMCQHYYLIDPRRVQNPFAVECVNALEWFVKTQVRQQATHNEANMQYVEADKGVIWQFLTPSPLLTENQRLNLMRQGLEELRSVIYDKAFIHRADWEENFEKDWRGIFKYDYYSGDGRLVEITRK